MSVAYVEDKKTLKQVQDVEKAKCYEKGDSVGGFVLKEIEADKIMLSRAMKRWWSI